MRKRLYSLNSRFNFVRVLMDTRDIPFSEAVHATVQLINTLSAEFQALEAVSPIFNDVQLTTQAQRYMRGLRDQLSAAWHWQISTNRYRSPSSPFELLRVPVPEEVPA